MLLEFSRFCTFILIALVLSSATITTSTASNPTRVIVTGAGGRTGSLVFKKLLECHNYYPIAVVRTAKSAKKMMKTFKVPAEQVIVGDCTDGEEALYKIFSSEKAEKLIMCTSAVPKIKMLSLVKLAFLKLIRKSGRPSFYFGKNGTPYEVDYIGAKNQIDASKRAGIDHFIFLSSMGGTQPDNFLNSIGKEDNDDKSGNILLWKRKAEEYLIKSGMKWTICHPGGLVDKKVPRSVAVIGFDDKLLEEKLRSISRYDLATILIQTLQQPAAINKSFDVISKEVSADTTNPYNDWSLFFAEPGTCKY